MARSVVIGLSIAAPVGPIGVLCIRRTLADGRLHGLVSGLGAATADGFYGFIAAFGLTAISSLLIDNALPLQIFGVAFLAYLGLRTLFSTPATEAADVDAHSTTLFGAYLSTFVLTITNPMTVLAFLGVFAGLGADVLAEDRLSAVVMVIGVFAGSALWWLLLSAGVSLLRGRITARHMLWVNRISGMVILLFALSILGTILA